MSEETKPENQDLKVIQTLSDPADVVAFNAMSRAFSSHQEAQLDIEKRKAEFWAVMKHRHGLSDDRIYDVKIIDGHATLIDIGEVKKPEEGEAEASKVG